VLTVSPGGDKNNCAENEDSATLLLTLRFIIE